MHATEQTAAPPPRRGSPKCQDCLRPIRKDQPTGDYRGELMHAHCAERLNTADSRAAGLVDPRAIVAHGLRHRRAMSQVAE